MLNFRKKTFLFFGYAVLWITLIVSSLTAGYKKNTSGSLEVVADVTNAAGSATLEGADYILDSIAGQPGSTGIWIDADMELFAGFLSTLGESPYLEVISAVQRTDGSGDVDIQVECSDPDKDLCKLRIKWSTDGITFNDLASITPPVNATVGENPSVDTGDYQIGVTTPIVTTSSNTLSIVWEGLTDLPDGDGTFYLQFTITDDFVEYSTTTAVVIDNKSPFGFALLGSDYQSHNSVRLVYKSTAVETHFSAYKIYYSSVTSSIDETFPVLDSGTYASLGDQFYLGESSITVSGLVENATYYFGLWCYDTYGNKSSTDVVSAITKSLPIVTIPVPTPAQDGTGHVTVSTEILDANDDICKLGINYSLNNGTNWYKAYITSASADIGTPNINNSSDYQLENIQTDDITANQLAFVWDTANAGNENGPVTESENVLVRILPSNDVTGEGDGTMKVSSTTFTLDNVAPTAPANFTPVTNNITGSQIGVEWTSSTENRFSHYEIWYSTITPVVRNDGTSVKWSKNEDTSLANVTASSTIITGLMSAALYYMRMWAVDTFGNETINSVEISTTTHHKPTVAFTVQPSQLVQGNGKVIFSASADDGDRGSDLLSLKVEFSTTSQTGPWTKAVISEVNPSYSINNSNEYQISGIDVTTSAETLNITWDSLTDLPDVHENNVYIKLTVNDTINDCDAPQASNSFSVDNLKPAFVLAEYTHDTRELSVSYSETISTFNVSVGVTLSTAVAAVDSFTVTDAGLTYGTTGFICALTEDQRDRIAYWQRQGWPLYISLSAGVVKDSLANTNTASADEIVDANWHKDNTNPRFDTGEYSFFTNKLILNFNEKMSIASFQTANLNGIRIQEDRLGTSANYITLSSLDTLVTQLDDDTISIELSNEHLRSIAGWEYINNDKEIFISIDSNVITITDLAGVNIDNVPSSNAKELGYTFDQTVPLVLSISPVQSSIDTEPAGFNIKVKFNEKMYLSRVIQAVSVKAVRNQLGKDIDVDIAGTITYDDTDYQIKFIPAQQLDFNYKYKVTLAKENSQDISRNQLAQDRVWYFSTVLNAGEYNIVVSDDKEIKVDIEKDFLTENAYIDLNTDPLNNPKEVNPDGLKKATNKKFSESSFNQMLPGSLCELNVYGSKTGTNLDTAIKTRAMKAPAQAVQERKYVNLTLPYQDLDRDGMVDGTYPPVRVKSLRMYWYDEEHSLWVRLPDADINIDNNNVLANTLRFGTFALIGSPDTDLSEAYAYPVPFKPSEGHTHITFTNLASECSIKIYTISGELVKKIEHNSGFPVYDWDVTSEAGNPVFSGVYIYFMRSKTHTKEGKIMIIR
ncbi:Ig-like domain-containing protein [bacterium]